MTTTTTTKVVTWTGRVGAIDVGIAKNDDENDVIMITAARTMAGSTLDPLSSEDVELSRETSLESRSHEQSTPRITRSTTERRTQSPTSRNSHRR